MKTKLSRPSLSALNELGSRFTFIVKNAAGVSGGIMIGADRNEITKSWEGEITLVVITRRKRDGWSQMETAVYGPNQSGRQADL